MEKNEKGKTMQNQQIAIGLANEHPFNGACLISRETRFENSLSPGHFHFLRLDTHNVQEIHTVKNDEGLSIHLDGAVVVLSKSDLSIGWFQNRDKESESSK